RVWALPFLTVLAPSERYAAERGRRHKKLTDWARQLVLQARRWMPARALVLVADSSFAALDLLADLVRQGVTCVTRLRLASTPHSTPQPPRRPPAPPRAPPPPPPQGRAPAAPGQGPRRPDHDAVQ